MPPGDYLLCAGVLLAGYTLNLLYITVFYHRGFTHGALEMQPWLRRVVQHTGNWVTGLDVKAWVCMHRLHHANADTPDDPHSPANVGIFGVAREQLRSYERILAGLARHKPELMAVVTDLDFEVNWLNRRRLWYLPYLTHAMVGAALSLAVGPWPLGLAYFLGIMSHPVQGWIVNSFGHAVGSRNFDTPDDSRNNHLAAWLIWGEGFQNNHHAYPGSADFSYRWWEVDFGYLAVRCLGRLGVLRINQAGLIPRPGRRRGAEMITPTGPRPIRQESQRVVARDLAIPHRRQAGRGRDQESGHK